MIIQSIFILSILLMHSLSKDLVYVYNYQNVSYFKCFKQAGYNSSILILYSNKTEIEPQAVQNILNAKNAGLDTQVVYVPCRTKTPVQQAQLIADTMKNTIHRYWISPSDPIPKQCLSWVQYSAQQNCKYLQELIQNITIKGLKAGVAVNTYTWKRLFKQITGCPQVSRNSLLWWVPLDQQQDSLPNFNNYHQIADWKKPYMKLYGKGYVCQNDIVKNYYE